MRLPHIQPTQVALSSLAGMALKPEQCAGCNHIFTKALGLTVVRTNKLPGCDEPMYVQISHAYNSFASL